MSSGSVLAYYSKSEILPLDSIPKHSWMPSYPFSLAKSYITYLGVKIVNIPYTLNYPSLIQKLIQELENWLDLPLSLLGRCHLFKIFSFVCLLYPLQTTPLLLKHKDV